MTSQINKIPTWFWIIAIISLLWNLMGVNSFIEMTFPTEESLSKYDEAMQNHILTQYDTWTYIAFAIAVSGGILQAIQMFTSCIPHAYLMQSFNPPVHTPAHVQETSLQTLVACLNCARFTRTYSN
jgi:hypothetical protein